MSGSISFGGLLSGLDTKSIVEQLSKLRTKQLVEPVQKKIDALADRRDGVNGFRATMTALRTSAEVLNNNNNTAWESLTSSSSDTDSVLISSTDSDAAIAGTYDISSVTRLAKSDRVVFNGIDDKDELLGEGTITIKYGTNAEVNITITSALSSLEFIKDTINNQNIGVAAAIVNDGGANPYRLVLTGEDTGEDNTVKSGSTDYPIVSGLLAGNLGIDEDTSSMAVNLAANASFTVNGLAIESENNSVTDAVSGVTFTLLETKATSTTLTIKQDTTAIGKKVAKFIDDYNNLRTQLRTALLPDTLTGKLGVLSSEAVLQNTSVNISNAFTSTFNSIVGGAYTSLAQIGITTDNEGYPTLDSGILASALDTNLSDVQALFQGTDLQDGIAEKMYNHLHALLRADGTLAKMELGWANTSTQLADLLKEREGTVERYKERLQAKYNLLEQRIASLKSKEGSITAFANANNNN